MLGSFVIGLAAALAARYSGLSPRLMLFIRVGLCGGVYHIFLLSLETFTLLRSGAYGAARRLRRAQAPSSACWPSFLRP